MKLNNEQKEQITKKLLNFGKKPEFRRKIYENKRKNRKNQF